MVASFWCKIAPAAFLGDEASAERSIGGPGGVLAAGECIYEQVRFGVNLVVSGGIKWNY